MVANASQATLVIFVKSLCRVHQATPAMSARIMELQLAKRGIVAASVKRGMNGHSMMAEIAKRHCLASRVMAKVPEIAKMVETRLEPQGLVSASVPQAMMADIVKTLCGVH